MNCPQSNTCCNSCCTSSCNCKTTTTSTTTIFIVPCDVDNCEDVIFTECIYHNHIINSTENYRSNLNDLFIKLFEKIKGYNCSCNFCGAIVQKVQSFTTTSTTTSSTTTTTTTPTSTTSTSTSTSTSTTSTSTSSTTTTTTIPPLNCDICKTYQLLGPYTYPFTVRYVPCGETATQDQIVVDPGLLPLVTEICVANGTTPTIISGQATPSEFDCCLPTNPTAGFSNCEDDGLLIINKTDVNLNITAIDDIFITLIACISNPIEEGSPLFPNTSIGAFGSFETGSTTITASVPIYCLIYIDNVYDSTIYSPSTSTYTIPSSLAYNGKLVTIVVYQTP